MDKSAAVLYCANWCHHCKKLIVEWEEVVSKVNELNKTGKYDITLKKLEEGEMTEAEKHSVDGFPTIKITKNGKTYDYTGKRTAKDILEELTKKDQSIATQTGGSGSKNGFFSKYSYYKQKYLQLKKIFKK